MNKFYFFAMAGIVSLSCYGEPAVVPSKINAAGLEMLRQYRLGELDLDNPVLLAPASRGGTPMVKVTIQATDGVADSLSACGYTIVPLAQDFAIVTMPLDQIETLSASEGLRTLSFGNMAEPEMNLARPSGAVNVCVTNPFLDHPYEGEGVIVGAFDTGFDPQHINFMNADGTATRLVYYANYNSMFGKAVLRGQETLKGSTDNRDESHATHVVGIAAGSYSGSGFTYSGNTKGYYSGNPGQNAAGNDLGYIPYYGVAPKADIAVCAGSLSTANILEGVRDLIDFAKSEKKPIVINLSLGNTDGPHDGTETDVQALNAMALEAPICISSGNEGDANVYAGQTITTAGGSFYVMLAGNFQRVIDCWSSTSQPFDVTVLVVEKSTGRELASATCTGGRNLTINNSTEGISEYVSGSLGLSPFINTNNNRYDVRISGSLSMKSSYSSTHAFALKLTASDPARIDVYGNSYCTFVGFPITGYVNPSGDGSINGMACGKNTICVGAYNTRQWWFTTGRESYCYNGSSAADNSISSFSSYGTLTDGRQLPDFCAPGSAIISSYSSDYVATRPAGITESLAGSAMSDGKTYYWGVMQGTSMSCPFATGTIALWLEENPNLTSAQIKEIVAATAIKPTVPSVAWGAGRLSAFQGLRRVINFYPSGIDDVIVDGKDINISVVGGNCEVFAAGASKVRVKLYTVGGALAAAADAHGDTAVLPTAGLAKGVYVLHASDGRRTVSRKIAL